MGRVELEERMALEMGMGIGIGLMEMGMVTGVDWRGGFVSIGIEEGGIGEVSFMESWRGFGMGKERVKVTGAGWRSGCCEQCESGKGGGI